jgi:Holliday junction resolvasome RuvABC endonuclease subunit
VAELRVKRLARKSDGCEFVGIDQSARGTAAVALDSEGKLLGVLFWADTKSSAKALHEKGALPPMEVKAGDEGGRTARLDNLRTSLGAFLDEWAPKYAALEDYALARLAFSHHLGEVGAVVRLLLWSRAIQFRVYDVQAVKMFATGKGNAEKADVVLACRDRWEGRNFLEYGKTDGAAGNVADAYVIGQLLRIELRLREGSVRLEDLSEVERRVFQRTSKQRPENLLATPFACREGSRDG